MTLLFYPNFFRGKLPPNKIGLFLIRRHSLNIKIGEEIGEGGIVRRGWNWVTLGAAVPIELSPLEVLLRSSAKGPN